jgi:hypothetical protein
MPQDGLRRQIMILLGAVSLALAMTAASQTTEAAISPSAHELVQQAVDNELKASNSKLRYSYQIRKQTPNGSTVKQVAETNDGQVSYLLMMNDQPLTDEQRRIEDEKNQKILNNPDEQRRRLKEQKDDERRATSLVKALPDAFIYEFDSSADEPHVVKLRFRPNPSFDPPDRETQVFKGMAGHMYIDTSANRMKRLDGTLVDDVNFGWGIFGRLRKGGHFEIHENDVGNGHWDLTYSNIDFTGKVLLFKKLKIKETQEMSDFRRIPENLSYSQGFDLLRKENQQKISAKR